jgi:hypothetical protein
MSNLDATGWSRLLAGCICAAAVDMITMLEENDRVARFFAASQRSPTRALMTRKRSSRVNALPVSMGWR